MTANSTEDYTSIEEIYQKFSPIFQYENIDKLTADDFQAFFKTDIKQFFTTRHKSLEHQYTGIVSKPKNFSDLKKALKILVNESKSLDERLEEIFQADADFLSWFKSDIFSPILHVIAPNKYAIFNTRIQSILESKYNDQFDAKDWKTYEKANRMLNYMAGERNCSLYELDQQLGGQSSKPDSSYYKIIKEAIEGIQDQANYQYVMMRFLLGKNRTTRDEIAEELKRWNGDKPDNFDFKRAPVFDTNIIKNFTDRTDDTFVLQHRRVLNFYERHQLISLCEEKIRGRIDTHNEGTIPYSDLVFSPLTDKQEIKKVHDKVVSTLTGASSKNKEFKAYQMYGKGYWLDKHNIFFYTADPTTIKETHFWDVFGTREPSWDRKGLVMSEGNKDWILEINPPIEGGWHVSGQFLKDNQGRIYYTHNGSIKVNKSKNNFRFNDIYAGLALKTSNYSDGEKHSSQYIISDVASLDFVDNVADYVKEVQDFRNFVETPEYQALGEAEPTEYWMIRAGGKGSDWENQRNRKIAAIHYYSVDLSKCTERDGILSEEKVKEKVVKIRKESGDTELTPSSWAADYGQLEKIFSVNRTGGKCRIFVIGLNKDLLGFGDATSQYEYKEGLPNPHAINVEWIDTNKRELPESFRMSGFNRSIKKLTKEEYDLIMAWPLTDFLRRKNNEGVERVTLDVDESSLENAEGKKKTILKHEGQTVQDDIITTARTTRQFWSNTSSYSHHWTDAGYTVKDTPEPPTTVTFVKDDTLQADSAGVSLQEEDDDHCDEWKDKGYEELLKNKKQMIFYGPPGTGKTWTAKNVAKCFTRTKRDGSSLDKFIDRIIDELKERAEDSGYTFEKEGNRTNQNLYVLKKDEHEVRVDFHEANTNYFQVNAGTTFLTENPEAKNYLILTKDEVESFVCLPYETEQKYSKFVSEGDGTGGWDPTGKGKHSVHNLKINETEAHFEPKDEESDSKDVSKYLNTWNNLNQNFAASNRGKDIYNVTFHPSYSYEDFVEGFRPNIKPDEKNESSQYVLDDGIFKKATKHAKRHNDRRIVLIIDEINRGNIPKIFGELISIVENDKRGPTNTLKLAYSKEDFFVPENLFIIGTMNTADKSLVQMDEALRRRFGFEELMPNADLLDERYEELSVPKSDAADYKHILEKLNDKIVAGDRMRQYRDKQIGHSYFWDIENDHDLRFAIKYQIIPLLQDYFYDDYDEIKTVLGNKIIGKQNRPTGLLDKGRETELKDVLLKFLNKSGTEPEEEQEEPEPEEEQEENAE